MAPQCKPEILIFFKKLSNKCRRVHKTRKWQINKSLKTISLEHNLDKTKQPKNYLSNSSKSIKYPKYLFSQKIISIISKRAEETCAPKDNVFKVIGNLPKVILIYFSFICQKTNKMCCFSSAEYQHKRRKRTFQFCLAKKKFFPKYWKSKTHRNESFSI